MKVQVKYKHHYELFEVGVPVEVVLYPGDEAFWSNVSKRKDIEAGDVFIISKTIRLATLGELMQNRKWTI